ncbi:MAG: (2Fe-2S)-binding protein [Candidatus Competibacterales bacterium]|nr:(2Fe-2S)-binding protein [Candidatus Competibacterales bacterium]
MSGGAAMYVCICKAVTDRQMSELVEQGVTSMGELRQRLDVCGGCGKCGRQVRQVFGRLCAAAVPQAPAAPAAAGSPDCLSA